eukprot:TRINITY_DN7447_c0_g1_i3.p1 TRINITY_DN7447_c0_g1~~TRINITY_DN7447_c0_g1_i3.p1  ORF type:complete len:517 (+),score=80.92 TRINITY_DN7447_c0_g1_i3:3-1553(+)
MVEEFPLDVDLQLMLTELDSQTQEMSTLILHKKEMYLQHSRSITQQLAICNDLYLIQLQDHIFAALSRNQDQGQFDGRGGWSMFLTIIAQCLERLTKMIQNYLPDILQDEKYHMVFMRKKSNIGFTDSIKPYFAHLECLNRLFPILICASFLEINNEEIEEMVQKLDDQFPFWYDYDPGLSNFRRLLDTAKSTIYNSNTQTDQLGKLSTGVITAVSSLLFSSNSRNDSVINVSKNADIEFLKLMWNIPDKGLISNMMMFIKPLIHISKDFSIPYGDKAPIKCRVVSNDDIPFDLPGLPRKGQNRSFNIMLHFHGGGFVAGSSKSHEVYLRSWAKRSDFIIISVDYSLAPEAKYPVAHEQCFHVYRYLFEVLGLKPTTFVVAGDSAGGNLSLACTYYAILNDLRKPNALLLFYPAVDLRKTITASKVAFVADVLLPYYFLTICQTSFMGNIENDIYSSPILADIELLQKLEGIDIRILSAGLDPLLDDTVNFVRKLRDANIDYTHEWFFDLVNLFLK